MKHNKILFILYLHSRILHLSNKNFFLQQKGDKSLESKNSILTIRYKDYNYKFIQSEIDKDYYVLYSIDGKLNCVGVIINKTEKIAEIHEISNYKSCIKLTNLRIGSLLLKLTIKMLEKYKDKFNINKILLTDNSIKKCGDINIILSKMLILISGDTWYGKYNFRPNSQNKYRIYKNENELYEKNKIIMNTIKLKDIDIIKYIRITNNKNLVNATYKLIDENPNMLVKDYLQNLLSKYDITCKYFGMFYNKLFNDLGLTDFRGVTFEKII